MKTVDFTAMKDGSREDYLFLKPLEDDHIKGTAERVLRELRLQEQETLPGYKISRLTHGLQSATRAYRDGRDEEYVVCALLHDVGDILAPSNHAELGAMILKPYISEQNWWMMDKHGIFQGYYFFHHLGLDRDMRDEYRGHPWFEYTAQFCHLYDQNSFDPGYDSMPLSAFEPMIHRVTAQPKRSIYRRKEG